MRNAVTVAKETVLSSLTTEYAHEHELTLWNNVSLTIEHWMYQYSNDQALDHCRLDKEQVRKLRDLLNSPEVAQLLDV